MPLLLSRALALPAFLSLTALAQNAPVTPIDPLQRPQERAGGTTFNVSLGLTPSGAQLSGVDASGNPVLITRQSNVLGLTLSGSYSFTERLSLSASAFGDLSLVREAGSVEASGTSAFGYGLGTALNYRLAPTSLLDPRVSVGLSLPLAATAELGVNLLRDPVVLSGSLGFDKSLTSPAGDALLGLGAGFIANERVTLSGGVQVRVPVTQVGVPTTSLNVRAGYALDASGQREVGVRTTLSMGGGSTRVGVALEFGTRG